MEAEEETVVRTVLPWLLFPIAFFDCLPLPKWPLPGSSSSLSHLWVIYIFCFMALCGLSPVYDRITIHYYNPYSQAWHTGSTVQVLWTAFLKSTFHPIISLVLNKGQVQNPSMTCACCHSHDGCDQKRVGKRPHHILSYVNYVCLV